MKTSTRLTAIGCVLLSWGLTACGSSGSTATTPSTTAGRATPTTVASTTTAPTSSGGDADAFCGVLLDARHKANDLKASVDTPEFQSKLEIVHRSNDDLLAAAPAEIEHAAQISYQLSFESYEALDPSLSPQDKMAKTRQVMDDYKKPEFVTARNDLTTWVRGHCGSAADEILAAY